jgi:hypothetical protein
MVIPLVQPKVNDGERKVKVKMSAFNDEHPGAIPKPGSARDGNPDQTHVQDHPGEPMQQLQLGPHAPERAPGSGQATTPDFPRSFAASLSPDQMADLRAIVAGRRALLGEVGLSEADLRSLAHRAEPDLKPLLERHDGDPEWWLYSDEPSGAAAWATRRAAVQLLETQRAGRVPETATPELSEKAASRDEPGPGL